MQLRLKLFPSPLGVSYFQIIKMKKMSIALEREIVSVPSRGILFPNQT